MVRKKVDKEKALEKLENLCSRSEQCEFELERKLIIWGLSVSERKEIIDYLKEYKYLDESRYAGSFARDKARFSYWGPNKIKFELKKRRIKDSVIKEALESVSSEIWKNGLLKNAVNKAQDLVLIGEDGWINRRKLYNFLLNRGFAGGMCSKAVNYLKKKQESEDAPMA